MILRDWFIKKAPIDVMLTLNELVKNHHDPKCIAELMDAKDLVSSCDGRCMICICRMMEMEVNE